MLYLHNDCAIINKTAQSKFIQRMTQKSKLYNITSIFQQKQMLTPTFLLENEVCPILQFINLEGLPW